MSTAGGTEVQLLPGMSSIQHHLNQVRWSGRGKNVSCKIVTRTIMEKVCIYIIMIRILLLIIILEIIKILEIIIIIINY